MVRGLYAAASGMVAGMLQQDVIAHNLANVDTPGYKKDVALVGAFADDMAVRVESQGAWRSARTVPLGWVGSGSYVRGTGFDRSEGPIVETGAPLDLAIEGDGYFVVEVPEGEAYTRNGSFTLNARGELVTEDGTPVLGESGRIVIPAGGKVEVRGDGRIAVDGQVVARLRLVAFDAGSLPGKAGGDVFVAPPGTARSVGAGDGTVVRQGFLEMSNVTAVTEMVQMIAGMRAYEACQRVVWFLDQTLDKSINDVGRPA
ncbi:MAG: flagellar basal-body rod protein FlgF [Clostridia bacterium]